MNHHVHNCNLLFNDVIICLVIYLLNYNLVLIQKENLEILSNVLFAGCNHDTYTPVVPLFKCIIGVPSCEGFIKCNTVKVTLYLKRNGTESHVKS